jgi:methionyl-tRNA formyltransferase
MRIVFMGSPDFAVASLGAILNSKHKVELVVTQPDKPANRGQALTPCAVAEYARANKLRLIQPVTLKDRSAIDDIKRAAPDCVVVVAYGKLLPKALLDIPPKGCVNVHASLLPKYRGAAPINWAIIKGEAKTGVTTMFMSEKMDEGDILLQCSCEVMPHETAETLHDHLASVGAELIVKTLDRLEEGALKGVPQDHKAATFGRKLTKEDGLIDWKRSASGIYNYVRGLQPWPKAYTHIGDAVLIVHDAAPMEADTKSPPGTVTSLDRGIIVQTGYGQICLLEVQLAGKKRQSAVDFIKGSRLKVGDKL